MSLDFAAVLTKMVEVRASDVHLTPGFPPAVRVRGRIVPMDDYPPLSPQETREIVYSILNDSQRKRFENQQQLDFAYAIPGVARFRVNCFFQRGAISAAFRHIPTEIHSLESLGLPLVLEEFTRKPRGFVLVTGPTGSGQVDDPRLDGRHDQRGARGAHPDDRGPDRVPPLAQEVHRQPARDRRGRPGLLDRPEGGACARTPT